MAMFCVVVGLAHTDEIFQAIGATVDARYPMVDRHRWG
jgi:hypothetical protein